MTKFTRRQALKTGIAGAAFVAVGATPSMAAFSASGTSAADAIRSKCASLHPLIGQNLAMMCEEPSISQEAKNHALKTTSCPHCNVGITPFGGGVNFVRL